MSENIKMEWLLECLIHVIGRAAIKLEGVQRIVGSGKKQIEAFNLCNGSLALTQIAKRSGLDQASFSRSVERWVKNGIVFRLEEGRKVHLLHIFPIPPNPATKPKTKRQNRR